MEKTETEYLNRFENGLNQQLVDYLQQEGLLDSILPDTPDLDELFERIGTAYITDGVREFQNYPVASLGWMMFVGMAAAYEWDDDWQALEADEHPYERWRDVRGYDLMDEYIREEVLRLAGEASGRVADVVEHCARMVYASIQHEQIESSTPRAFYAFVRCLQSTLPYGSRCRALPFGISHGTSRLLTPLLLGAHVAHGNLVLFPESLDVIAGVRAQDMMHGRIP